MKQISKIIMNLAQTSNPEIYQVASTTITQLKNVYIVLSMFIPYLIKSSLK